MDGTGRLAGGLGATRDAGSVVHELLVQSTRYSRGEPLTNSAARAAAAGKSLSLPSSAGEVSRRLAAGLESFRQIFTATETRSCIKTSKRAYDFC